MPRCTSTNKFAPYDEPYAEWAVDPDITDNFVEATIRIIRPCAECGEELAEAEIEVSADFESCPNDTEEPSSCEYIPDATDPEVFEESGPTTRTLKSGVEKPIPPRFVKTYFGAESECTIKCATHSEWEGDVVTLRDRVQASHFEVLVD